MRAWQPTGVHAPGGSTLPSAAPRSRPATASQPLQFQFSRPWKLPGRLARRRTDSRPTSHRGAQARGTPRLISGALGLNLARASARSPPPPCRATAAATSGSLRRSCRWRCPRRRRPPSRGLTPGSLPQQPAPALISQEPMHQRSCSLAPQVSRRGHRPQTAGGCMALAAPTLPTLCSAIPLTQPYCNITSKHSPALLQPLQHSLQSL